MSSKWSQSRRRWLGPLVGACICLPSFAAAQLTWTTEVVDPNTVDSDSWEAGGTTIRLDSSGYPWISYVDGPHGGSTFNVRVAVFDGSDWSVTTVDWDTWGHASMALDSNDNAHICFRRSNLYAQGVLWYATGAGNDWDISNVDPTLGLSDPSIAVDGLNRPHIAYGSGNYSSGNRCLKYAQWTGLEWDIHELDPGGERTATSIALDSLGLPHISYMSCCVSGMREVKYAHWDGTDWVIDTIDLAETPLSTSIALDASDRPHIAYTLGSVNGISYATKVGSDWETELITTDRIWYARLALDPGDRPRIAYYHADDGALVFAARDAGEWTIQVVDDDPSPAIRIGRFPSIAVGADGSDHISYYSHASTGPNQLKYAGAEPSCPGDLDGDGDVDLADLAQLLAHYGTTSGAGHADGDLDGDGDVDLADLAALLAVYGTDCNES